MIFLILEENAEKAFLKLRDWFVRAKRKLKKKARSGTSSVSANKLKERLESLKFLSLLNICIRSRSTRSNVGDASDGGDEEITDVENNLNFTETDGESEDLLLQSVAVTSTKTKPSIL